MQDTQTSNPDSRLPAGPSAEDDETLARRAGRDPQAFAELYSRHVNRVYRFHLLRTGSVADAQDLTSQTFLAALENVGRYSGRGRFCGWLLGIAGHKVADHYRRQRSDVPLESAEDLSHSDPPPEEVAATHLELERVSRALQALAPEQNQALTLRIFGELSATEVGRIMGKSEAAVKMLVHRGLRKLQERLTFAPEVSQ
jgi:RNA polymerase sigma-70 factor (ECF subfamily)